MIRHPFVYEEGAKFPNDLDTGYFVVLRKNCSVGVGCSFWANVVIDEEAVIGNRVKLHVGVYVSQLCVVGDDVFMGPGVKLLNDRYPPRYDRSKWEPVFVSSKVRIGGGAIINPGVTLGEGCKVAAGAVVIHDVPAWTVVAGNPAHHIDPTKWNYEDGVASGWIDEVIPRR